MHATRLLALSSALLISAACVLSPREASGTVIFTISEVGSDVVSTTNGGSLDLTGLGFTGSFAIGSFVQANDPLVLRTGTGASFDRYGTALSGPSNIGSGTFTSFPAVTGGPIVGIRNESAIDRHVFVPAGYSSGDPLGVSTATWTGETLDSLGLAIGSYTWTWAGDSMTVNIVPEPTTALLLATGLAGLAVRRRRLH